MKITILLLSFNGAAVIGAALNSLLPLPEYVQLVVLDNGSHDESVAIAKEFASRHERVTVVEHGRNLGFSGGMNHGIRLATGEIAHPALAEPADIVILFNQDARALPGLYEALAAPFAADQRIAAVGCLMYDEAGHIEHLGGYLEMPQGVARHIRLDLHEPIPDGLIDVEYATGAVLALRAGALKTVGLFDERYHPAYCEEVDLCYRLKLADLRVVVNPAAQAIHSSSLPHREDSLERARMYNRGRLLLMLKTRPFESFMTEFVPAELHFINENAGQPQFEANLHSYADAVSALDEWLESHEEFHGPLTPQQRAALQAVFVRFQHQSSSHHSQALAIKAQFEQLKALITKGEQTWNLQHNARAGAAQTLALRGFQRVLGPLMERQSSVNAILVHVLYWLMELSQRSYQSQQHMHRIMINLESRLVGMQQHLTGSHTELMATHARLQADVATLTTTQTELKERLTMVNRTLLTNAGQWTDVVTSLHCGTDDEHYDPSAEF